MSDKHGEHGPNSAPDNYPTPISELTLADVLLEIRRVEMGVQNGLDAINSRLEIHERTTTNALKDMKTDIQENKNIAQDAKKEVQDLREKVHAGINAVRILAWLGAGLLAVWGIFGKGVDFLNGGG